MEQASPPPRKPSPAPSAAAFCSRHAPGLLALVPFAALIWLVAKYGVDVPFWDQWDLVPLLDRMYAGRLTFSDVWAPHNEHRILFPQLIMLGLARLTGWNIRYELAVNVALALGVFAVLAWQIRRTARTLGLPSLRWAIPACSLVVFSLSQYQNWLWGWQIQMLLNLLAATGGIVLLADPPFNWRKFAGAALLGIVATYSFANGVVFWPIGLALLVLNARQSNARSDGGDPAPTPHRSADFPVRSKPQSPTGQSNVLRSASGNPAPFSVMRLLRTGKSALRRTGPIVIWLLISLLAIGAYLWHYQKPASHPPLSVFLHSPAAYAAYFLKYLGGIGAQYYRGPYPGQQAEGGLAFAVGLLGFVALIWAGVAISRSAKTAPTTVGGYALSVSPLLPYFALAAYSVATALLTGIGRVGMGSDEALESRYCTMVVPFWVSLIVLLLLLANAPTQPAPGRQQRRQTTLSYRQTAALWTAMAAVAALGFSSFYATEGAANLSDVQAYCRTTLLNAALHPEAGANLSDLVSQGPYLPKLVEGYPVLVKNRLSLFH